MVWRAWIFCCGLPAGNLAALALDADADPLSLELGALAGGVILLLLASLAARLGDENPERGGHLAAGATWALASAPALAVAILGLGPATPWLLLIVAGAAAVGILRGARRRGPALGMAGRLGVAALVLLASGTAFVGLAALAASLAPEAPAASEQRAAAIYDADANVVTRPLPSCRPRATHSRVLLDRGAHPRLDGSGRHLWFDARSDDGSRQVHRLELASGRLACWTCGQPGNNRRPAPDRAGRSLVFDSDRHTSLAEPTNTELYLMSAQGEEPRAARRISYHPGADDHALLGDRGVVVWSRGWKGSFDVVSASLRSGHGARFLADPGRLFRGGTHWTIPLDWSADRRHLVIGDGQPLRPLRVTLLDPATDATEQLSARAAPGSAASFVADGGWMLLASTERAGAPSLLPESLGFLLPRLYPGLVDAGRFRTTRVHMGEPGRERRPVELGALADWGAPTGIASGPMGRRFVLGQRRQPGPEPQERLVEVELDCDAG